jgi:membrane protein DedA with SNARE-associated domain
MEEILHTLFSELPERHPGFLYAFLFASSVVENLFPPVPGDTITAFGAFLVGTGKLLFWPVYLVTTLGSVTGFMLLALVGRKAGRAFFLNRDFRFFPAHRIQEAEKWFTSYGSLVVLGNRFFPGFRSVISIVTGISRIPMKRAALLALVSAALWNMIWIQAGYYLGSNWEEVLEQVQGLMKNYNIVAFFVLSLLLLAFIVVRWYRSYRGR